MPIAGMPKLKIKKAAPSKKGTQKPERKRFSSPLGII